MKRLLIVVAATAVLVAAEAQTALAWKPFTHARSGESARLDALDGNVTVNGREYAVNPAVVTALTNRPAYFNAGVIGPDGFPDLVYGQSIIHPEKTGKWLRHILQAAWAAQSSGAYNAVEKEQILAFAYGYATHAAGDMWAHTFVNDFAEGVFPSVFGILNGLDDPMIAVRHLIVEGYIGDATPGYDGNDDRTLVFGEVNEDNLPEISDDSSPAIEFEAPHEFIYETLVNPSTVLPFGTCGDGVDDDSDGTPDDGCPGGPYTVDGGPDLNEDGEPDGDGPEPKRGKLIDFFIDMKADLQVSEARYAFDSEFTDCALIDPDCFERTKTITVHTVRGVTTTQIGFNNCEGATIGCLADPGDLVVDVIDDLIESYLEAWIDDIDDGLRHWSELGLASTRALFDPGTMRQAQNYICRNDGAETDQIRIDCEDGVGVLDVLEYTLGSEDGQSNFLTQHLLSMVGLPDFVGDIADALSSLSALISDIVGPAFNPLAEGIALVKEELKEFVKKEIGKALGVDIDQLKSFLTHPTHWINVESASFTLPFLGTQTVEFFPASTHPRLDELMGLPAGHHGPLQSVTLPGVGGGPVTSARLADSAVFNESTFAAYRNTLVQARLLLLPAAGLNGLLRDEGVALGIIKPGANVPTYQDGAPVPANVMVDSFGTGDPWLRSIDGDHQWRVDGMPRFCDDGAANCDDVTPAATERPARLNGGNGNYPLWESCIHRPAFRTIFSDWENTDPLQPFPAFGDGVSSDPGDPSAPDPNLAFSTPAGQTYVDPSTSITFVSGNNTWTATGSDAVFVDSKVALQYRYFLASGPVPGAEAGWSAIANGGTFQISGVPDGLYKVQIRAADPCHTFGIGDGLAAGAPETTEVFLDTTPPEITITSPLDGALFDTDDFSSIDWTATDAGSGVASQSGTFDGAATTNGATLDMFYLYPGAHTVSVTATDNVGNSATETNTFELHATSVSLLNNVKRACGEAGAWPATPTLISKTGVCHAMKQLLAQAVKQHADGDHAVEHNVVAGWAEDVEAQRGKAVDAATADRFIAYANDLIATGG